MVRQMDDELDSIEAWFQSCECHSHELGSSAWRLAAVDTRASKCPFVGLNLHLLVAGRIQQIVAAIYRASLARGLQVLTEVSEEQRHDILRDWHSAKDSVTATIALKLRFVESLPYRIAVVAVRDEAEAIFHARACQSQWAQQPRSRQTCSHWRSRAFLEGETDPALAAELRSSLAGQPRESLPSLQQELAVLRLVPTCEVPIEAKHALAKANL
jgi:hypothetical protein